MTQDSKIKPIIGPLNAYSLLALAGVIGPIVFIVLNLIVILSAPDYDMLRSTISSLAWTPLGWVQSVGFFAVGILVELFATGLLFSIDAKRGFRIGIALLVCVGFGLLMVGAFREDPIGHSRTVEGIVHTTSAGMVFFIFPIASSLIAFSLRKDPYWKGLFLYTVIATALALSFVFGLVGLKPDERWSGLYEQILVANMVIWVEVMAIRLLNLSIRSADKLKNPPIMLSLRRKA